MTSTGASVLFRIVGEILLICRCEEFIIVGGILGLYEVFSIPDIDLVESFELLEEDSSDQLANTSLNSEVEGNGDLGSVL